MKNLILILVTALFSITITIWSFDNTNDAILYFKDWDHVIGCTDNKVKHAVIRLYPESRRTTIDCE